MGTVKIGDFGLSRETVKNGIEELDEDCEGLQNRSGVEHAESITAGVGTRFYASLFIFIYIYLFIFIYLFIYLYLYF